MTGAQHYREAERLLAQIEQNGNLTPEGATAYAAQAQAHAILALAAATAYPAVKDYLGDEASEPRDWTSVTERKREGQS